METLNEMMNVEIELLRQFTDYESVEMYLEKDVLRIIYVSDEKKDYLGARMTLTYGGPNIYLDTFDSTMTGYWGLEKLEIYIPESITDKLDEVLKGWFDSIQ